MSKWRANYAFKTVDGRTSTNTTSATDAQNADEAISKHKGFLTPFVQESLIYLEVFQETYSNYIY